MIYIDDREGNRARILRRMGLTVKQRRLEKIDADMCNKVGRVELKEIKDWFQATKSNKRYWKQLYNAIISDRRHYVLIVFGDVDQARKDLKKYVRLTREKILDSVSEAFVRGAGINVVYIENEKDAVYVGYKMLKYMEENKWGLPKIAQLTLYQRRKMGRPTPTQLQVMRIWEVPKGVAENLLKKFKTVRGICLATKRELLTVDGVGDVTARKISGMR